MRPVRSVLAPAEVCAFDLLGDANAGNPPKMQHVKLHTPNENKTLSPDGKYLFLIPLHFWD